MHWNGSTAVQNEVSADGSRVTYMSEESQPTLMITELRESDTNVYCCGQNVEQCRQNAIQLNVSGTVVNNYHRFTHCNNICENNFM